VASFTCAECGSSLPASAWSWRCSCGGTLRWLPPRFDPASLDQRDQSLWRYRAMLPPVGEPLSLGEGGTPLVAARLAGQDCLVKVEFCQPSGSYKDRGNALLSAAVVDARPAQAVEDSSGNAGASLAGYLAKAGVPLRLFVPRGTAAGKLRQARAFHAEVDDTAPTRVAATQMAQAAAAQQGTIYASHVWSPYFLAGMTTLAYELWAECPQPPASVVVPAGNGLLVLGLYLGFESLRQAGLISAPPAIHAVQAAACAPLAAAWAAGSPEPLPVPDGATAAGGVRVALPARGREVLAAVRASGGSVIAVAEEDLAPAVGAAATSGWFIEPTAALAVAALSQLPPEDPAAGPRVVVLTGSGLKAD
jgi:threonine synthase